MNEKPFLARIDHEPSMGMGEILHPIFKRQVHHGSRIPPSFSKIS
jgi:hypothetical protein